MQILKSHPGAYPSRTLESGPAVCLPQHSGQMIWMHAHLNNHCCKISGRCQINETQEKPNAMVILVHPKAHRLKARSPAYGAPGGLGSITFKRWSLRGKSKSLGPQALPFPPTSVLCMPHDGWTHHRSKSNEIN